MYSSNKIIRTISLIGAFVLAATTAQAVDPPPDGGYPGGNTAEGADALFSLVIGQGFDNTAIGFDALYANTTGGQNTADGASALQNNTTGGANTANGVQALFSNTTGSDNTANGNVALAVNTTGSFNTANGVNALELNSTGINNVANGYQALHSNTTGIENTANGANALFTSKTGIDNTANGSGALFFNRFGSHNTAIGRDALFNNKTGAFNIAFGDNAGFNTTGNNNIDIGNEGVVDEGNTIRIGKQGTQTVTFVAGINGATVPAGVGVIVDTNGHLGTVVSSQRFKDNVQPMDKASEAIFSLEPVAFRYKKELDPKGIPQFGLVAEQVEKVNPDLVARDEQGKPYTVRYEAVNAMLLNEFLKEHRKGEQQNRKIEELEAIVAQLQSSLKAQAAQIQKVSGQLRTQAPAPHVVAND